MARDRTHSVLHLYLPPDENPAEAVAFLRERYAAAGIGHEVMTSSIKEEDWAYGWKAYFKPLPVGERLLIQPTWEPRAEAGGRRVLTIDPGMAFGTGGHDTTRLVLETLETVVQPGCTLLDVGCGSGILSIAALLLGAQKAVGVDIDPLAVRTAVENGRLNGFSAPQLTILEGDLVEKVEGAYDVVAANIVADAIIQLSPAIPRFLKPDGVYIVSGIIDTREADVQKALAEARFAVTGRREQGGWICLSCRYAG